MKFRICDLKVGDLFYLYGYINRVKKIENGRIYFINHETSTQCNLGQFSKQIIEKYEG